MIDPLPRVIILSAPSGGGKSSLARTLVSVREGLSLSISHTTRPAREGEQDGLDYFFVEGHEFDAMVEAGRFLEYAEVFDHFYGTSRDQVNAILAHEHSAILDIDWQGARKVRATMPDALSIFILPPSLNVLEQRLIDRGQDSNEIISRRMCDALDEINHFPEFDYIIVNELFDRAIEELSDLIFKGKTPKSACNFDVAAFVPSEKSGTLQRPRILSGPPN